MESFMEVAKAQNWAVEPQGGKKEFRLLSGTILFEPNVPKPLSM
jgi:hypothetical protein